MLIDTHCHIHFPDFDNDRAEVIRRAHESGVKYLINVGTDPLTNEAARKLAVQHKNCSFTAGLHPHHAHELTDSQVEEVESFVRERKPAAIGEIGLDYFKSQAEAGIQKKMFIRMIHLALQNDLPVIVHSRNAFDDTWQILRSEGGGRLRGVMHCFSYGQEELRKVLELGFNASFTANITYKSASELLAAAVYAPIESIMLETDAPYLAPQVHRGKRNEPAYLLETARHLAAKKEIALDRLEHQTTQNAVKLFDLKDLAV